MRRKHDHFVGIALRPFLKNIVCFELCWQFVSTLLHLHYSIMGERSGCKHVTSQFFLFIYFKL